jgi:hypothetical protein
LDCPSTLFRIRSPLSGLIAAPKRPTRVHAAFGTSNRTSATLGQAHRAPRFRTIQAYPKDRLTLPLAGWNMRQTDQARAAAGRSMIAVAPGRKPHARSETPRVHHAARRRCGGVAARGARANQARPHWLVHRRTAPLPRRIPTRPERVGMDRRRKCHDRANLRRWPCGAATGIGCRAGARALRSDRGFGLRCR